MSITLFEEPINAGFGAFIGNDDSYKISLENYLIGRKETTVCVRVKGDSMNRAGIMPDDLVLVDKSLSPNVGDIVIAVIDGSYTIKYFQKDKKGKPFLKVANTNYKDIYPEEELEIFGVVVSLIRKYK